MRPGQAESTPPRVLPEKPEDGTWLPGLEQNETGQETPQDVVTCLDSGGVGYGWTLPVEREPQPPSKQKGHYRSAHGFTTGPFRQWKGPLSNNSGVRRLPF